MWKNPSTCGKEDIIFIIIFMIIPTVFYFFATRTGGFRVIDRGAQSGLGRLACHFYGLHFLWGFSLSLISCPPSFPLPSRFPAKSKAMAAPLRLGGSLALVTGGGSGIGRAICTRLAREGATVAIADCDEAGAAKTLEGLQPGDHQALHVDVGCARSVANLMAHIQTRFSRPANVCVNCAGITMDEFLLRQTEAAFDAVLRVNLKGTFLVTQAVARALVESGASGGSIINIGSIVGKVGNLGQVNYAASKAGVEALSKTVAKELARYGIRCNTVLPGFIHSPMTDKVPQKVLDKFAAMVPLGRLGEPEDVADVCAFLALDESRYITGASVEVTGGLFI